MNNLITIYFYNIYLDMPMWRNWQTHQTQNLAGNHVGSSPTIGTNDGSLFELIEQIDVNIIQKWMIFFVAKIQ